MTRLQRGGAWIDRDRPIGFSLDGSAYRGFAGDTLASALLANGVRVVARSFKYHRPRGITGIGSEEPCALLTLGSGARATPNVRATVAELTEGLVATSQNRWPNLRFDFGALTSLAAPLLPAGFYYKTFMWPRRAWLHYEEIIRRIAGLGRVPAEPDPDCYDKRAAFADILVVGGGPAGLSAALVAARAGARVVLADEHPQFGASLAGSAQTVSDRPAERWAADIVGEIAAMPRVTLLRRTTVAGAYDNSYFVLCERLGEQPGAPRERLWKLRCHQAVLAAGASERPLVFANNDVPGVMMANAVRGYLRRFAVLCGRRPVVFTNNDSGYATAFELAQAGVDSVTVVDCRSTSYQEAAARQAGITVFSDSVVRRARGQRGVYLVEVERRSGGATQTISCDLLCVSGGWSPNVHLLSQSRERLRWDDRIAAFVPEVVGGAVIAVGACNGTFELQKCIADGLSAGAAAAHAVGLTPNLPALPPVQDEASGDVTPLWHVPGRGKRFVDLQTDVTTADVALAAHEGYRSIEHLKRYTTLGMGTDQGKLGNVNGLALLASAIKRPIPAVGTTTFRPPYTPVTVGAIATYEAGEMGHPIRRTALHAWHEAQGAIFMDANQWLRPLCYPRDGEDVAAAAKREMAAVRGGVGLVDVTPLGKIDVQGPDATEFLERVYVNALRRLPTGRGRYGLMLREDGMVFDDGVIMRLADQHFHLTTSTANAEAVLHHMEFLLQVRWPDLRVCLTSVTEQWFAAALNGPRSREVLAPLCDFDLSNDAFSLMSVREAKVAGLPARVMRISFSGELAYEINVPADAGPALWTALVDVGPTFGLVTYGVEAMGGLRIEKGHVVVGAEIDGRTTPQDLGLGRMVRRSGDFIGRRSLALSPPPASAGRQLVGLVGDPGGPQFPPGAHVVLDEGILPQVMLGPVTSWTWSVALSRYIGLALLHDGTSRIGQRIFLAAPTGDRSMPITVSEPLFYDPEGARLRA